MFYSILVFIAVIIFLFKTGRRNSSTRYMASILVFYMMALLFLALYLSKDTYYYNTANYYFALPKFLWRFLLLLSIPKSVIIRLCNFCVLGVLYLGLLFSLSYSPTHSSKPVRAVKISSAAYLLLEAFFYDPFTIQKIYYFLYPKYMSVSKFEHIQLLFHRITMFFNLFLVLLSLTILSQMILRTSQLRMIRRNIGWIAASYFFTMLSYEYFFFSYPCCMIKVSRLADQITYLSAPLSANRYLYTLFPYFIIVTLLFVTFSIYRGNTFNQQLKRNDFSISRQIAASDITSRTFCHYMKNEILAIQAELDDLELNEKSAKAVQNVINRCDHLYSRLDVIHRNTHAAALILQRENLEIVIKELTQEYLSQHSDIQISFSKSANNTDVLIDRNYFEQAVHNILANAVEAMVLKSPDQKRLSFTFDNTNGWVILSIQDNGRGISREHLADIFTPFYTSEPVARHWGIGLSLTHKVIVAHEGHIEVESTPGEGTIFRIMLPAVS